MEGACSNVGRPGRRRFAWDDAPPFCQTIEEAEVPIRVARKLVCLGMTGLLLVMLGRDPLLALAFLWFVIMPNEESLICWVEFLLKR